MLFYIVRVISVYLGIADLYYIIKHQRPNETPSLWNKLVDLIEEG
jgi:hypothetical protein